MRHLTLLVCAFITCSGPVACTNLGPAPSLQPSSGDATALPGSTYAGFAWAPVAPLGIARSHLSAATVAGEIYAIGGLVPQQPQDGSVVVERYDVASNTWRKAPDLPAATDHAATAASSTQLFVFGGTFATPSTRAYRFDVAAGTWTQIAPLPEARAAAGAAFIDGRVYVVGGFGTDRKELAAAYGYDPAADRWERIADLPTPREHLAVVAYRGAVCALGGHFGQADQTAVVECYDLSSHRWSTFPPLLRRASDFAAVAIGDEIWAVGDDVQVFDGRTWSLGPALGTPRFGVAAAVLLPRGGLNARSIYVIGGAARRPAGAGLVDRLDLP